MAEKKKFQIPSAAEIEKDAVSSKQGSLSAFDKFKQMKKEGKVSSVCDLDKSLRSDRLTSDKPSSVPGPARLENAGAQNTDKMSANSADLQTKPATLAGKSEHSKSEPSEVKPSTSADAIQLTAKTGKGNYIVVNIRQRGNPILKHIRSIPYEYGDIVPDYVMGQSTCALFLSLRYHQLNPNYIHDRLKKLGRSYELRVLLVQVDIKEPQHLVKDLAKICILADCTLMLAFSPEEAGRYLETYKVYENKPADAIMEKTDKDYMSKMIDCLTSVKSVNKTDSMTLLSKFETLEGVMNASKEDLTLCAGFGPQKAKRLHDIFQEPFLKTKKLKE